MKLDRRQFMQSLAITAAAGTPTITFGSNNVDKYTHALDLLDQCVEARHDRPLLIARGSDLMDFLFAAFSDPVLSIETYEQTQRILAVHRTDDINTLLSIEPETIEQVYPILVLRLAFMHYSLPPGFFNPTHTTELRRRYGPLLYSQY
jgi:hypothetical protein